MRNESKIGFIGLGNMGLAMATNLIQKGFSLVVHDIRTEPTIQLNKLGAEVAETPEMVARKAKVVLISLPGPNELKSIILNTNGILAGSKEGDIIIDFSTVDPQTVKEVNDITAKKGVRIIDAPVSGGVPKAKEGTLTIMVGATENEAKPVMTILKALGENIFFVGKLGGGAIAKLINNYVVMCNMAVIAEAFNIVEKMGVINKDIIYEIMKNSSADSYVLRTRVGNFILKEKYEAGFSIELGLKDIGLALQMGKDLSTPLFIGTISNEMFRLAKLAGLGKEDIASLFRLFASY